MLCRFVVFPPSLLPLDRPAGTAAITPSRHRASTQSVSRKTPTGMPQVRLPLDLGEPRQHRGVQHPVPQVRDVRLEQRTHPCLPAHAGADGALVPEARAPAAKDTVRGAPLAARGFDAGARRGCGDLEGRSEGDAGDGGAGAGEAVDVGPEPVEGGVEG